MAAGAVATKDAITRELVKCAENPEYFLKSYAKIVHPTRGKIPFKTYPFQDECLKSFIDHRFNIVLKSRQLGLSTLTAGFATWYAMFTRDKTVLVIATKLDVAMNFIKKVKTILTSLPPWFGQIVAIKGETKKSIELANGSTIVAVPTSEDAGRSEALSLLIVDEAAIIKDFEEVWTGLYPTISCVTGDTLVLTDNGFVRIAELCHDKKDGEYFELRREVWGKNGIESTSHGYVSPPAPTLKFKTRRGLVIETTHEHPLFVLDESGDIKMIKARQIQKGHSLRVQVGMQQFGSSVRVLGGDVSLDEELGYQLGGYIAEGWMPTTNGNNYGIWISNSDSEFRDAYLNSSIIKKFHATSTGIKMIACSKKLCDVYKAAGIDPNWKCDTKRVPREIFQSPKAVVAAFLRGYFDGDGSASEDGICAVSTSERLLRDVQMLLLNFGIISDIKKSGDPCNPKNFEHIIGENSHRVASCRQSYRLTISRSQLEVFAREISFRIVRKRRAVESGACRYDQDHKKLFRVPAHDKIIDRLEQILHRTQLSLSLLRHNFGVRWDFKKLRTKTGMSFPFRRTSTHTLAHTRDVLTELGKLEADDSKWLEELAGSGFEFFWDDIVSIEDGYERTYDFTVPKTHTFLQNCILGSNTGGRAILLSTPKGAMGQFYDIWQGSVSGENDFYPTKLMWYVHPEHDEEWFKKETRGFGQRKIAQEFLCVGEGTRIVTKNGYTNVEDLCVNDQVLTHKGRFRRVLAKSDRLVEESEKLFAVTAPGSRKRPVVVTGNHPAFSYRFWANGESSFDVLKRDHTNLAPVWIPIEEIASARKTTDRILNGLFPVLDQTEELHENSRPLDLSTFYPSIDVSDDTCRYKRQWGSTKRFVDVDFSLGKLVGLYLAEGCKGHLNGLDLGFHIDEYDTHRAWVETYLQNLGCRVLSEKAKKSNACRIWTYNKHIGSLVRHFVIGVYAHQKTLNWEAVMNTNVEFIKGLLEGHYLGDGNHTHDSKFSIFSTSAQLVYQLRTLYSMFSVYPRIGYNELQTKNSRHHDMWYLEFFADGKSYRELLNSGNVKKRGSRSVLHNKMFIGSYSIDDISDTITRDGGRKVFDITVEEDSSFVAESLVLHNCDFNASGDTFVQPEDMDWLRSQIVSPIDRDGPDNNVWIWENPIPGEKYVLSADVARGNAEDFSTFHIFKDSTSEMVVEYKGKIPPDELGGLINTWATKYNTAFVCPENNTFGYSTIRALKAVGYKNLYYEGRRPGYVPYDDKEMAGFSTQKSTREKILTNLERMIRNKTIVLKSERLYLELKTFVWVGMRARAQDGHHDDLVMCAAISSYLLDPNGGTTNTEDVAGLLSGMSVSTRDPYSIPGMGADIRPVGANLVPQDIRRMTLAPILGSERGNIRETLQKMGFNADASVDDFSWVIKGR